MPSNVGILDYARPKPRRVSIVHLSIGGIVLAFGAAAVWCFVRAWVAMHTVGPSDIIHVDLPRRRFDVEIVLPLGVLTAGTAAVAFVWLVRLINAGCPANSERNDHA